MTASFIPNAVNNLRNSRNLFRYWFFSWCLCSSFVRFRFSLSRFLLSLSFGHITSFGGDGNRHFKRDLAVEFYLDGVLAGFLDWILEHDLSAIDLIAFRLKSIGDIHRSNRTKKRPPLTCFAFESK